MKRKLINYEVFESIENDSLTASENELIEAEGIVAQALGKDGVKLRCFGAENVVYETANGEFIHATYALNESHIVFDNIEQLVLDEESERNKQKELLTSMVDSLLEGEEKKAEQLFGSYVNLPVSRRSFNLTEAKVYRSVTRCDKDQPGKCKTKRVRWENKNFKSQESSGDTISRMRNKKKAKKRRGESVDARNKERNWKINKRSGKGSDRAYGAAKKTMKEALMLAENVFNFIDYREYGPALNESEVRSDERGNTVALRIPRIKVRNEATMQKFKWDTLNTDVVYKRNGAKKIVEDINFCQAIAELKRHNALSDNEGLEESLENIVSKWPQVLYLTQPELSEAINISLELVNATNYDDTTCDFMAEGILRMAHKAYADRAGKIVRLAGHEVCDECDQYEEFQNVVADFYSTLDESTKLEMQIFVDLYESLRQFHVIAEEHGNHILRSDIAEQLDRLVPILQQEIEPDMDTAATAASFLWDLVETNLETSDWNVSNSTHKTVSGDHPAMAQKARQGYSPASDSSGDWGDPAPASDGKSYRGGLADEMRNRSWGNEAGGGDTFPSLSNPYVPNPFGSYKIKGEKTIDADSGQLAHWSTSDTWPNLQNPYVPKSVTPQSYKMKDGSETDLVVDQ